MSASHRTLKLLVKSTDSGKPLAENRSGFHLRAFCEQTLLGNNMSAARRELGGAGNACSRCLQAQATHSICQIIDGKKEIHNLCDRCAEKWKAGTGIGIPDLRNAKCFYCGAGAVSGSLNQPWERQVRGEEYHYACPTCLENYSRRFIERLKGLSMEDSVPGQIQQMARMVREVDSEVRAIATRSKN